MSEAQTVNNLEIRSDENKEIPSGSKYLIRLFRVKKKWFDVIFVDDDGIPVPNVEFEAEYANGVKQVNVTNESGYFRENNTPEGDVKIKLLDGSPIESYGTFNDFTEENADTENNEEVLIAYIIRKGDTLSKIGKRFGIGWRKLYRTVGPDEIKNSDRLRSGNPNLIYPGELIFILTKRRVVQINTDNAAKSLTMIRIRNKERTPSQQRNAQKDAIYEKVKKFLAIDNLAIIAGWDDDNNRLNGENLCELLTPILELDIPTLAWNLYIIQKELESGNMVMTYFDSNGDYQDKFWLTGNMEGRAGAYTTFEYDANCYLRGIYNHSAALSAGGSDLSDIKDRIIGDNYKQRYLDSLFEEKSSTGIIDRKKIAIFYFAPSTKGDWQNIILEGGCGRLENYIGNEADKEATHERNLAVLDIYNSHFQGKLRSYIEKVNKISTDDENAEEALKNLKSPPKPYLFPLPDGWYNNENEMQDLIDKFEELNRKRSECSIYEAWVAIGEKIHDIQEARWGKQTHEEGSMYFRLKVSVEPSVEEGIYNLLHTAGDFSEWIPTLNWGNYKHVKLEWNVDIGTDGLVTGKSESMVIKDGGTLQVPSKFRIGGGKEIEIDESGDEKTTVKGEFSIAGRGFGMEVSDNGDCKMTTPAPIGSVSASGNTETMEGGVGYSFSIPGGGSIYLGLHFQSVKPDTLLIYILKAPGFFERRGIEELKITFWTNLNYSERQNLMILGWNQYTWDAKDKLPTDQLPDTINKSFNDLKIIERHAAIHLGFQGLDAENWKKYWKDLKPVKE